MNRQGVASIISIVSPDFTKRKGKTNSPFKPPRRMAGEQLSLLSHGHPHSRGHDQERPTTRGFDTPRDSVMGTSPPYRRPGYTTLGPTAITVL
ncbi:hypothetical protein E2C01_021669 [Portunus trituberculatus]|uniref:Uncharacterized protein n=1 Tax=Portunus trituberculatus TaxID=210409 RepID=A0A5B7E6R8_PORTR|nr:hypothetical protein [Portunus trituberculatus]